MIKCTCDLRPASDMVEKIGDLLRFEIKLVKCPLCDAAPELLRLLDLIVMEFNSDPMSVQCFDLHAIVEPTKTLVAKLIFSGSGEPS